jgi:hypothetical protein
MVWYTNYVYINNHLIGHEDENEERNPIPLFLLSGIVIPFIYECISMKISGVKAYFSQKDNIMDVFFILMAFFNCLQQYYYSPFNFDNKVCFIIVIFLQMLRTFKYLRIFRSFSPIVTMLINVIIDLQ